MKPLIRPVLPLLIATALAACGKEEAKPVALSCQAPEAIGQLTDQIQAAVSPAQESGLPYFESGASEGQAAFGQLGFEITDIRTTQAASEGSKTLSCEATLRLAPKPEAQARSNCSGNGTPATVSPFGFNQLSFEILEILTIVENIDRSFRIFQF